MNQSVNTQATLGQRIDALIDPLNAQAEQHRAALQQARVQIQQIKQQIDSSEQALGEIEQQMVAVLQTLASEEPMLAKAMGSGAPPTAAAPAPITALPPTPVPVQPEQAQVLAVVPADAPLALPEAEQQALVVPTQAQNEANVAEIANMLDDMEDAEQVASPTTDSDPSTLSADDAKAHDEMLAIIETGSIPASTDSAAAPAQSLEEAVQHAADVANELEQPPAPPAPE